MAGHQNYFKMLRSIHGRAFGISSSKGLITESPGGSSDVNVCAQMWGPGMFQSLTAEGTELTNYGITYIATGSTAGSTFYIDAPVPGVRKTIVLQTSATSASLQPTDASVLFQFSSAHFLAAGGSTIITYLSASATNSLGILEMVGLSTTQWLVTRKPAWVTT